MRSLKIHREAPTPAGAEKTGRRSKPELVAEALARGTRALSRILPQLPPTTLATLVAASADERVLVSVVMRPEVVGRLVTKDPLLHAKLRGVEAQRRLLEIEGGTLSADEAGALMSVSRQAVDKARRAGRLLALPLGRRHRYPAWQFGDQKTIDGLREVLAALPEASPWTKVAFFLSRNTRLDDKRPVDLLRKGKLEDVLRAARAYGQHGAS